MSLPEPSARDWGSDDAFRDQLQRIAANRHSPEAAALYKVLFDYTNGRIRRISPRLRLSTCEQEEIVGEVLLQLMMGGLASFRGNSLPELLGFVRTITDRFAWKRVRSRDRERVALDSAGVDGMDSWTGQAPASPADVELHVDSPLEDKDQSYLLDLFRAGSKAEYARRAGVSRAAVTQRVQRIKDRIADLAPGERMAHEVWVGHSARAIAAFEE